MPPFVGRKRRSSSPLPTPEPAAKRAKTTATKRASKPPPVVPKKADRFVVEDSSDSSSLSDVDSDDFEDVPPSSKNRKKRLSNVAPLVEHDEDDVEWEDTPSVAVAPELSNRQFRDIKINAPEEPTEYSQAPAKKAASKREKQTRLWTHQMHVQFLLWHNAMRNEWLNDKTLHAILLRQLPSQISREIEKWKRASGLDHQQEQSKQSGDRAKVKKWKANGERNERDWGRPSQKLEQGRPDMSHGDPIISLLKVLAAYWKKRFAITAPAMRKRGYSSKPALRKDIESYRKEKHHPAKHGERVIGLDAFRSLAEKSEGSRDVGAQLFTALLRAVGIEARLVASLQPSGYGFSKAEEMVTRRVIDPESSSSDQVDTVDGNSEVPKLSKLTTKRMPTKRISRIGVKDKPINLDDEDQRQSSTNHTSSDESVVDVTPSMPKARAPKYDKDLAFPTYWTEAISPVTSKIYPVSPFVFDVAVASTPEAISSFEPRGAKAEKAHLVMAYVIAHSADYTAKEVTIRYLRKQIWPGKTKGFRVPIEKVPIYDQRGKVKRYEEYDWFKHVLNKYQRPGDKRTAVDKWEDEHDLLPADPEKKPEAGDTLQSLKTSSEFVIEKHLRREEALVPGAEVVRDFHVGKGDKIEALPVYNRSDVRKVMTAESWHKEGRAPKQGEAPMKLAPVRAVTLARKREAEEHLMRTGEKQMQGLYSQEQTDWIIPPPIQDGKIPKNSYGNIDCFVPSMVPAGAVHLPLKGSVRICKKLEVDFAEAVVGFEFGNKMAVPVILGVVIAKENERLVRDAWRTWNEEQRKREESKMETLVLDMWRKMAIGLRIKDRVNEEYGVDLEPQDLNKGSTKTEPIEIHDEEMGGGFMPDEDHVMGEGGGFLVDHEEESRHVEELTLENQMSSQIDDPSKCPASELRDDSDSLESSTRSASVSDLSEVREPKKPVKIYENPDPKRAVPIQKRITQRKETAESRTTPASKSPISIIATNPGRSVRKMPARSAKGKARASSIVEPGSGDDSESDINAADLSPRLSSSSPSENTSPVRLAPKRGRGRPRLDGQASATTQNSGRRKRLLRQESTVVTSPYFDR